MKTRILKLLNQNPAGMSHGDIAAAIGEPQEHVLQCLFLLHANYQVGRTSQDLWHVVDVSEPPPKMRRANWGAGA